MRYQLPNPAPIANDETLEAPAIAQHVTNQPLAGVRRDPSDVVERRHYRRHSGIDCCLVRRQIRLPQRPLRQLHRVVIAPTFSAAVRRVVLDCGEKGVRSAEACSLVAPLKAAHLGGGHHSS